MLSRYFASAPAYRFFHTPMHRRDRRKHLSEKLMATLLKKGGAYFSLAEDSRNLGFGHRSRRGHAATASDSYYLESRRAAAAGFDRSAVATRAFTRRNTPRQSAA